MKTNIVFTSYASVYEYASYQSTEHTEELRHFYPDDLLQQVDLIDVNGDYVWVVMEDNSALLLTYSVFKEVPVIKSNNSDYDY